MAEKAKQLELPLMPEPTKKLPEGWQQTVKVLPSGHTQIIGAKRPPEQKKA